MSWQFGVSPPLWIFLLLLCDRVYLPSHSRFQLQISGAMWTDGSAVQTSMTFIQPTHCVLFLSNYTTIPCSTQWNQHKQKPNIPVWMCGLEEGEFRAAEWPFSAQHYISFHKWPLFLVSKRSSKRKGMQDYLIHQLSVAVVQFYDDMVGHRHILDACKIDYR